MTVAAIDGHPRLEVKGLRMHLPVTEGIVVHRKIGEIKAVNGIGFSVTSPKLREVLPDQWVACSKVQV
jgi:hypothetical protein